MRQTASYLNSRRNTQLTSMHAFNKTRFTNGNSPQNDRRRTYSQGASLLINEHSKSQTRRLSEPDILVTLLLEYHFNFRFPISKCNWPRAIIRRASYSQSSQSHQPQSQPRLHSSKALRHPVHEQPNPTWRARHNYRSLPQRRATAQMLNNLCNTPNHIISPSLLSLLPDGEGKPLPLFVTNDLLFLGESNDALQEPYVGGSTLLSAYLCATAAISSSTH
jgi:hypothetical protein